MKKVLLASLLLLTSAIFFKPVYAVELAISGNGSGSDSEVALEVTQETVVEQTNEAEVANDIQVEANTGDNQTSGNTGEGSSIQTGDINTHTEVENNLNTSTVEVGCCEPQQSNLTIAGNGTDSQNSVDLSLSQQTVVIVDQKAKLLNQIGISANTGDNTANDNLDQVEIKTGNISGSADIQNSINNTDIGANSSSFNINILVKDNGSGSVNNINLKLHKNVLIERNNVADLLNEIIFSGNTGGNQADGNSGNVSIKTGDISFNIGIKNDPLNTGSVSISCCDDPSGPGTPQDPSQPAAPPPATGGNPSNGGGGDSSGNGNGSSSANGNGDGEVLGLDDSILPATGSDWMLLAMIANILMFLMGLYLRLRSGRSPGYFQTN